MSRSVGRRGMVAPTLIDGIYRVRCDLQFDNLKVAFALSRIITSFETSAMKGDGNAEVSTRGRPISGGPLSFKGKTTKRSRKEC